MESDHRKKKPIKKLTAGGNLIDYPGEVRNPTSYLTTMKLNFNSAISDIK